MDILTAAVAWLYIPVNAVSAFILAPIRFLPGWLSITAISAIIGVLLLIIFKYTSNQSAIGKIRDGIKADMIAIKLFKDNVSVILSSQRNVLAGSLRLLLYALQPMAVMIVPVLLILSQMGLWYQNRPLLPGESTIITIALNTPDAKPYPETAIDDISGAEVVAGPVHVLSKNEILWEIRATEIGTHDIRFRIDGHIIDKTLTVGDGYQRISKKRPGWRLSEILAHPAERPFQKTSLVQSITIEYPDRKSKVSGNDWWIIYFFVCSMLFALIFKPLVKVKI